MMHMTFYWGTDATILFDSWRTDSWTSYSLSLLALFLAAAFYQYMEDRRLRFKILPAAARPKASSSSASSSEIRVPLVFSSAAAAAAAAVGRIISPTRSASAVLFGFNSAIGYLLMLAVMSFNAGVFIAVVVGLAVGYLFFRSEAEEEVIMLENPCPCA